MTPFTQTAVARLARRWGVTRTSHDGPSPDNGGLGVEDIHQGQYKAILGRPEISLHELVHGILGVPPQGDGEGDGPQYDEYILVDPLEKMLSAQLGAPRAEMALSERCQLVAAGLLRRGQLVEGHTPSAEQWEAARQITVRFARLTHSRTVRAQRGSHLPAWW